MHTHRRSLLFIVPVVLVLVACRPQVQWTEFSSTKGRFSVSMPGTPETDHETEYYPGAGEIGFFIYSLRTASVEYDVVHSDFPDEYMQKMSADQFLDRARDEVLERFSGRLDAEKKILLASKHPGRELEITVEEENISIQSRMYLVGQRIYYVMVAMPTFAPEREDAARFLNSFKVR
jgi:hypothetical protein